MKHLTRFMLLSLLAAPLCAQSVSENRAYLRLGLANSQANLRAYLGGRAYSPIYEIGYDFKGPTEDVGFGLYASYLTAHGDPIKAHAYYSGFDGDGKPIYENDGLQQVLFAWRFGIDMRFRTPIQNLTGYAGASGTFFDGLRQTRATVQDYDYPDDPFMLDKGGYPEGKMKLGLRVGLEYRITKEWGVSLEGSLSSWLNRGTDNPLTDYFYKPVDGINPVKPAWISVSAQYRFNAWN